MKALQDQLSGAGPMDDGALTRYRRRTLAAGLGKPILQGLIVVWLILFLASASIDDDSPARLAPALMAAGLILSLLLVERWISGLKAEIRRSVKIILFRPFRPEDSAFARNVLAPSLARLGDVFTVYDHHFDRPLRGGGVFESQVFGRRFGNEFLIADDGKVTIDWRDGVFSHLSTSDVVVIDISGGGHGLRWEIQLARTLFAPQRQIVVRRASSSDVRMPVQPASDAGSERPTFITYGDGLVARVTLFWQLRRGILGALRSPHWRHAEVQIGSIAAALGGDGHLDPDRLEQRLAVLRTEFGESRERVWWYVRQALVEGNTTGLYYLNLREPSKPGLDAWEELSVPERYRLMVQEMDRTYPSVGPFREGPRAGQWEYRLQHD